MFNPLNSALPASLDDHRSPLLIVYPWQKFKMSTAAMTFAPLSTHCHSLFVGEQVDGANTS
jgi:hypothetical protein